MYSTDTEIPTLFDLLARRWMTDTPLKDVVFSVDSASIGFLGADGSFWHVPTADPESPNHRFRVAADTGRPTISPRRKPFARLSRLAVEDEIQCVTFGQGDRMIVGCRSGRVLSINLSGRVSGLARFDQQVEAIAMTSDGANLFIATDGRIQRCTSAGVVRDFEISTAGVTSAIGVSGDGNILVWGDEKGLHLKGLYSDTSVPRDLFEWNEDRPPVLAWNAKSDCLAVGNLGHSVGLVKLEDGQVDRICRLGNYQTAVRNISWGHDDKTLVTSGGFRIVSWDIGTHSPTAVPESKSAGRARFVSVETAACHPSKNLIAAGYQNGAIIVARPGVADDLVIRHAADEAPVAMRWSRDGTHLAFCTSAGEAAIVTFPSSFFK